MYIADSRDDMIARLTAVGLHAFKRDWEKGKAIVACRSIKRGEDGIGVLDGYVCLFSMDEEHWKLDIAGISVDHIYDSTSAVERTIQVLRMGEAEQEALIAELIKSVRRSNTRGKV